MGRKGRRGRGTSVRARPVCLTFVRWFCYIRFLYFMSRPIIIIGAGASGLMAAASAAELGHRVLLLERLSQPGQKLLATGGGRCNLTHDYAPDAFIRAFSRNHAPTARFLAPAIHHFPPHAIRDWFAARGVPTFVEPDGCVFPVSESSRDVLDALLRACRHPNIQLRVNARVVEIKHEAGRMGDEQNAVCGVTLATGETFCGTSVILATGGLSYPSLGADPNVFALLSKLGLAITQPTPALVPLVVESSIFQPLTGLTLENASVSWQMPGLATNGARPCASALLFTHRGLSGPAVLEASRDFNNHQASKLLLSTCAQRASSDWLALFASWRSNRGATQLRNLLSGEVPRAWAEFLCDATRLSNTTASQATRGNLTSLATALTQYPVPISDTEGWSRAMVTRGGVALSELDSKTLRCKRFPALRCIGEAVDLDGPCGGFNLTWAFSSAKLCAGKMFNFQQGIFNRELEGTN